MQANKIVIGNDYAAQVKGQIVAVKVIEIVTRRKTNGTTNYVTAMLDEKDQDGAPVTVSVAVDAVQGPLAEFTAAMAERKRVQEEAKAKEEARTEKRERAIAMLAAQIGAQSVPNKYGKDATPYDKGKAAVMGNGTAIEINEQAFDGLLAFLEKERVPA